jgi:hypothetical protein
LNLPGLSRIKMFEIIQNAPAERFDLETSSVGFMLVSVEADSEMIVANSMFGVDVMFGERVCGIIVVDVISVSIVVFVMFSSVDVSGMIVVDVMFGSDDEVSATTATDVMVGTVVVDFLFGLDAEVSGTIAVGVMIGLDDEVFMTFGVDFI